MANPVPHTHCRNGHNGDTLSRITISVVPAVDFVRGNGFLLSV